MATNIGTGPQDIPLNQFLGEMAFQDNQIEFGSWDPVIANLGNHTKNTAGSGGFYQRIGKMVYLTYNYQWSSRTTTNGAYNVKFTNIPWRHDTSIGNVRSTSSVLVAGVENILPANPGREHFGGYVNNSELIFRISGSDDGDSENSLDGSVSTANPNGYIYGFAVYITTGERIIS